MSPERCVECGENPGENYLFVRGVRFPLCDGCTEDFIASRGVVPLDGTEDEGDVDGREEKAG